MTNELIKNVILHKKVFLTWSDKTFLWTTQKKGLISNNLFKYKKIYKMISKKDIDNIYTYSPLYSQLIKNKKIENIGIRMKLSGRLNGVRMSKSMQWNKGNTNTQTYNINTSFINKNIYTKWGIIGLKIWLRRN